MMNYSIEHILSERFVRAVESIAVSLDKLVYLQSFKGANVDLLSKIHEKAKEKVKKEKEGDTK
jgi:hypothetical protein